MVVICAILLHVCPFASTIPTLFTLASVAPAQEGAVFLAAPAGGIFCRVQTQDNFMLDVLRDSPNRLRHHMPDALSRLSPSTPEGYDSQAAVALIEHKDILQDDLTSLLGWVSDDLMAYVSILS